MGERLSRELGVTGWVHYTPESGQNRFFDYDQVMAGLVAMGGEPEWLGYEEVDGVRCARASYVASGEELVGCASRTTLLRGAKYGGLGLADILGELSVELWIGEKDGLRAAWS